MRPTQVLYYALANQKYKYDDQMVTWLRQEMKLNEQLQVSNDNEWDAAISAWYTLVSIEQESPRDLVDEFRLTMQSILLARCISIGQNRKICSRCVPRLSVRRYVESLNPTQVTQLHLGPINVH